MTGSTGNQIRSDVPLRAGKHILKADPYDQGRFANAVLRYDNSTGDVEAKSKGDWVALRRLICEAKKGEVVIHLNGDKTDHRRTNLFVGNRSEVRAKMIEVGLIDMKRVQRASVDIRKSNANAAKERLEHSPPQAPKSQPTEALRLTAKDNGLGLQRPVSNQSSIPNAIDLPDFILPYSLIGLVDKRKLKDGIVEIKTLIPDGPWQTMTFEYDGTEAKQVLADLRASGFVQPHTSYADNDGKIDQLTRELEFERKLKAEAIAQLAETKRQLEVSNRRLVEVKQSIGNAIKL